MDGVPHTRAAARIRERKQRIIDIWEHRVRETLSAANAHDRSALTDSVPTVLDRLARMLESEQPLREIDCQANVSAEHGEQRAELAGFSLEHVIREYELLHEVLLQIIADGGALDLGTHDLVTRAMFRAVRDAATEFARRRAEATSAELRATGIRFKHMVDAVKDYAIFTLSPHGVITSWNEGCTRMKLYTIEEAVGEHFSMLYPDEGRRRDEPMAHLRSAALEGRFRGEGVRVRKSGEHFLADVSITAIYDDGTLTGFTKVVQDLTERNTLMQERDLSRTDTLRLRADAEYRERFVATLSHDLRSPLATAKAGSDLIALSPADVTKVHGWATRISEALDRADKMIADLLDASRLHAGEAMPLELHACDLRAIAAQLLSDLGPRYGNRFQLDAEGDCAGTWSEDGLRRVLDNLLSNAVKYGDPQTEITVRLRRADDRVLLSVHNFGTIIPIEDQERLFTPFHRAGAKIGGPQGWGIGLALVKGIVEQHGGIVKAESYPKEGTTFTADLPIDASVVSPELRSDAVLR